MNTSLILSILLLICVALIIKLLLILKAQRTNETHLSSEKAIAVKQCEIQSRQIAELKAEIEHTTSLSIKLREENSRLQERIKFIEEEKEKLNKENELRFKNLAGEILHHNTIAFKEQNETRLNEILTPLKENIEQFKKTISDSYSAESRERFSLQERIKELIELNQTIGKEAKDLTLALKGNSKTQGDWGEMILENILEKSGLEKGREFHVQKATYDENGKRLIADVVICYPDGRKVIIDSKVSLNAYIDIVNCDNPNDLKVHQKKHIQSIRNHINELKTKKYQDYIGTDKAEFIMIFIPNEGAYICAMQLDSTLWQEAYDNRVLLISPTHLISALKLIEQLWRHDRQTKNAIEIATESGKMYDKFVGFVEDMKSIERAINNAQASYNGAMTKLKYGRGNLIDKATKLKEMGAKASKALPQNES